MNVIAQMEFELAYFSIAAMLVNNYATEDSFRPAKKKKKNKIK